MTKTERGSANKSVCVWGRERGVCSVMCTAACGWASVQSSQIQVAPAAVSQNPITATTPFLRHTQPLSSLSSFLTARPNQTQWMSHSIPGYTLFSLWSHPVRFKRITAYQILYYFLDAQRQELSNRREKDLCATFYYSSHLFDQEHGVVLTIALHFYSSSHITELISPQTFHLTCLQLKSLT